MKVTGENRSTRGKICPSATSSTTNPTRIDPGSKPGLRGERPATNRLSHGTAGFGELVSNAESPVITRTSDVGLSEYGSKETQGNV
jgi:hypothetical protein